MKNISIFFTTGLMMLSLNLSAQIKIIANGNVGINTTLPSYQLDVNALESRFYYSTRNALQINHFGLDPRLCSKEKIVFFKTDKTGYAAVEGRLFLQHCPGTSTENRFSLENKGLATITQLRGLSFNIMNYSTISKEDGFLAEEVEIVIPEAVFKNDSTSEKSIAYSYIIPYLVEAIKEQQEMIDELKDRIVSLEGNLKASGIITASFSSETNEHMGETKARLDQNIPNPFNKKTQIGCFIPDKANSSVLFNYNANGTPVGEYPIPGKGKQVLTIDGSNFVPGIYFYKLLIDGHEIGSKKMIFTK